MASARTRVPLPRIITDISRRLIIAIENSDVHARSSAPSHQGCLVSPHEDSSRRSLRARDAVFLSPCRLSSSTLFSALPTFSMLSHTFFSFAWHVRYILLSTGTFSLRGVSSDIPLLCPKPHSVRVASEIFSCSDSIFGILSWYFALFEELSMFLSVQMEIFIIMKSSWPVFHLRLSVENNSKYFAFRILIYSVVKSIVLQIYINK